MSKSRTFQSDCERGDQAQIIFVRAVVKTGEQKSPWIKW